jgi:hypothetical protein
VVTDYDALNGILSITKARVAGVDRDRTKIAEDRRIVVCPRAMAVLEWQLRLRAQLERLGHLNHDHLFFLPNGEPIHTLAAVYSHWRHTLRRLPIRYRKPYAARHSSVSWDLMIGRNPLFVAQQHGHSLLTMLTTVYAAWTCGSAEPEIASIQGAMQAPAYAARAEQRAAAPKPARTALPSKPNWAIDWSIADREEAKKPMKLRKWTGGADGTRTTPGVTGRFERGRRSVLGLRYSKPPGLAATSPTPST